MWQIYAFNGTHPPNLFAIFAILREKNDVKQQFTVRFNNEAHNV